MGQWSIGEEEALEEGKGYHRETEGQKLEGPGQEPVSENDDGEEGTDGRDRGGSNDRIQGSMAHCTQEQQPLGVRNDSELDHVRWQRCMTREVSRW